MNCKTCEDNQIKNSNNCYNISNPDTLKKILKNVYLSLKKMKAILYQIQKQDFYQSVMIIVYHVKTVQ